MATIEQLIEDASSDMLNPEHNFKIAKEYEALGQTAAAMSFYLRTAEYGFDSHPSLVYASLIRISYCVADQSGREHTLENSLFQAIQYMPNRPEAYFVLSRYYERTQKWQQCYMFAELGLLHTSRVDPLQIDVEYYGGYCLEFEKAVSAWWIGRKKESLQIFLQLLKEDILDIYRSSIIYNIKMIDPNAVI
jgi:tetratricopeptide (TPR) repeat protein